MTKGQYAPATPGDMLKHEFLAEYGLSQNELAHVLGVSPNRIAEIVNNRRRITADTAVRLSLFFGDSPEFWMNLQSWYDLRIATKDLSAAERRRIVEARPS
jgi:addiction module HigA family antidote